MLTGAEGTFSAGMDLKAALTGESPEVPGRGFGGLTEAETTKPLIAAVEGWAMGGGFELALGCDLIVAAEDAKFGLPEVKRGLVAAGGGVIRLPKRIPYHLAMELLLTGEPISGERAGRLGIANRVVPPATPPRSRCNSPSSSRRTPRWRSPPSRGSSAPPTECPSPTRSARSRPGDWPA